MNHHGVEEGSTTIYGPSAVDESVNYDLTYLT